MKLPGLGAVAVALSLGRCAAVGGNDLRPAWMRLGLEAPAGQKDMGGWVAGVYTAEQQARLGVDELGEAAVGHADYCGSPCTPPYGGDSACGKKGVNLCYVCNHTRGSCEAEAAPATPTGVYTAEQQARLGVDELGEAAEATKLVKTKPSMRGAGAKPEAPGGLMLGGAGSLPPAWILGDIEAPAAEKDMGGWTAGVYTAEQQARLGVDEMGATLDSPPASASDVNGVLGMMLPEALAASECGDGFVCGFQADFYGCISEKDRGDSHAKLVCCSDGQDKCDANSQPPVCPANGASGSGCIRGASVGFS